MAKSCKALTRSGLLCSRFVGEGEEYCWQHKPSNIKWFRRFVIAGISLVLAGLAVLSNLEGVLSFIDRVMALAAGSVPSTLTTSIIESTEPPNAELQPSLIPTVLTGTSEPSSVPQPSSPASRPTPGFCDGTSEFCYYLPMAGESWQIVAENTAFNNKCAWPLIANINRATDGTYRIVGNILRRAGIFVPYVSEAENAWPTIRQADGKTEQIPVCLPSEENTALPCAYEVSEGDGLTGSNYEPLAWDYYRGIEKDGIRLDTRIMAANLSEGCQATPELLLPGKVIVIPALP